MTKCFQWMVNILAILLLLIAFILTLSRLSVIVLSHQRDFVEKWLGVALNQTVQIQSIQADWAALDPGLTVKNVLLKNPSDQQSFIKMKRLTITIDILRSILHWQLLPKRLTIAGVNLDIDGSHGRPRVRGILMSSDNLHLSAETTALTSMINWMLAEGDVHIQDVNIDYHAKDQKTYYLRHVCLRVINHYFRHRIYGGAVINKATPTKIHFAAKINDVDLTDEKFNANFYVSFRNVQLDQWANSLWVKPYIQLAKVKEGDADLELWGQWKKTKVTDLQGRWRIKNLAVQILPAKETLTINDMLSDFQWQPSSHRVRLQIKHIRFSAPNHYRSSLLFSNIKTDFTWGKNDSGFYLYFPYYQFALEGLKSHGQLYWHIPFKGKSTIDFISKIKLSNFSDLPALIPDRHRSASLAKWFKQAFISGGVTSGTIVYRGPMTTFPFEKHEAHLVAELHVNNGGLSYQAGWPPLTSLNGDIEVNDRRVSVVFQNSRIEKNPIKILGASLNDFMMPKLKINTKVFSNFSAFYQFMQHSPAAFSKTSTKPPLKGPISLIMQMQIDFSQPSFPIESHGEVSAIGNTFTFKVHTLASTVHVGFDGILNIDPLKSQWNLDLFKGISGKTQFKASIAIDKRAGAELGFTSDMKGIALSGFPNFVDKSANVPCPVKLHVNIPHKKPVKIALHYQEDILLRLLATHQVGHIKFLSGEIYVGKKPSPNYPTFPGFVVYGDIPTFHWLKWKPVILPFVHEVNGAIEIPKLFGLPLRYVEFHFDKMEAFGHHLSDMRIKLIPRPNDWMFQLRSPRVAGTFYIPNYSGGTWAGRLNYLTIPKMKMDTAKKKRKPLNIDPSKIPPIDIQINKLVYGATNYGQLELRTRPNRYGITINQFSVKSALVTLNTKGKWEKNGHHQSSKVSGYFSTENLGQLLSSWDIKDSIAKGRGYSTFQFAWPDGIDQIKPEILSGFAKFKFRHGRILKMDESKTKELSIGRIVNAFSLTELPRRLTLHFGDITAKGLEFRRLEGMLRIKKGICKMKDTLLDSPVAKLKISGTINFIAKNYNLNVSVAPYVTSSIPLIVGVAGGPIAGAIAWVVNKIATPEIGKIIGFKYHAQGSWDKSKNVKLPAPENTAHT